MPPFAMRYLVLTDIHANLEALEAAVADARPRGFEQVLVLGDVVGYGPDPNAVVSLVQSLSPVAIVRGNHDKVACGLDRAEGFNVVAKSAARWTLDTLTAKHRAWLAALPEGPHAVDETIEICHGAPFDEDAYIFDELDAIRALKAATRPVCLFGHTHYPVTFELSPAGIEVSGPSVETSSRIALRDGSRFLVNPGSVGQPRDGDPRAAYGIVDTGERRIELYRVRYAVDDTQAKVTRAGLPDVLGQRLTVGR